MNNELTWQYWQMQQALFAALQEVYRAEFSKKVSENNMIMTQCDLSVPDLPMKKYL